MLKSHSNSNFPLFLPLPDFTCVCGSCISFIMARVDQGEWLTCICSKFYGSTMTAIENLINNNPICANSMCCVVKL